MLIHDDVRTLTADGLMAGLGYLPSVIVGSPPCQDASGANAISAYGDAVVPQITEAIGRVMMQLLPTDGTVLDLFAGAAGGWSLGMHRAGYRTIAACEIDPWRREVFARRFG